MRALLIPQGEHEVEFRFEPESYYMGNKVSLASSLVLLLALAGVGFVEFKKRKSRVKEEASGKN